MIVGGARSDGVRARNDCGVARSDGVSDCGRG